jgi:pimeloyl-ACP methyl ester carboxylesterase
MHVERYGGGDRGFLCLHGWNGSHRTFEPLAEALPAGVSLWCPDMPDRESLAGITDELQALAATMPPPLRIIGNCSGALHALLLAERMPVDQIVMIDAFAYWPVYFRIFLAPVFGQYAYLSAFANPLGRWVANASVAHHRKSSTNLTEGFSRVDHGATYRQLHLLTGIGSPQRFRSLVANVQITYGTKSFAAIKRSAAIWKDVFPQATTHELAGAGHLPLIEAAGQLRNIVFEEKPCRSQ